MFRFRWPTTVLAIIFTAVLSTSAEATTYYVALSGTDSGPGTLEIPFRTIARGLKSLTSGDTLYIRGGTYAEQLFEVYFGAGGTSWDMPVTVAAYAGEGVTLRPVTSQGNVARFQDGSKAYVVIEGLVLDGISAGGGGGASVVYCGNGSHHLRFVKVEIRNGDGNGALCAGTAHEFRDLRVHHNGLSSSYLNSNGMYMTTDSSSIIGGEFYDNECYGVRFFDSDRTLSADNNVVRNARIYQNGYTVAFGGSSQCQSGGGGVVLGDENNMAANNLIYGNYWGFNTASSRVSNVKFYNNTVFGNRYGILVTSGTSQADIANNIIYKNDGSGFVNQGVSTRESNNLTIDPLFLNAPVDFALREGSPAIDAGVPVDAVTDDLLGTSRPQGGAFDAGALEFGAKLPAAPTGVRILR